MFKRYLNGKTSWYLSVECTHECNALTSLHFWLLPRYLLKSVVLARFFHGIVAPSRVDEETCRAKSEYVASG